MAKFIKVVEAAGWVHCLNVDWIAGFTKGTEPGLTIISFGGPVALPAAPAATTFVARIEFETLAKAVEAAK